MLCDYSKNEIVELLERQLTMFACSKDDIEIINNNFDQAYQRTNYCFSFSKNKYYSKNKQTYFSPFHAGQWSIFLYYLSNTIYSNIRATVVCDKIYYLNRALNSLDLFYEVNMPDIFMLDHPLGSVIGRGNFGNFFSFSQGCTVGNNKGIFPSIGENVKMYSNSKIIGKSTIGNNVIISANTFIKDQDIGSDVIVFGASPNLVMKAKKNV